MHLLVKVFSILVLFASMSCYGQCGAAPSKTKTTTKKVLPLKSFEDSLGVVGLKFVVAPGRPPVINEVFPNGPAYGKVQVDDRIIAINGSGDDFRRLTKEQIYDRFVGNPAPK